MDVLEWTFGFHRRTRFKEMLREPRWSYFGHVSAWGYTEDETFVFFDPAAHGTKVRVTHKHDDILDLMTEQGITCWSMLRVAPFGSKIRLPIHPHMNCVAQCAHLVGVRAYLPQTLHRILRANGAVELKDEIPQA